jgi:hypothetical protein
VLLKLDSVALQSTGVALTGLATWSTHTAGTSPMGCHGVTNPRRPQVADTRGTGAGRMTVIFPR